MGAGLNKNLLTDARAFDSFGNKSGIVKIIGVNYEKVI